MQKSPLTAGFFAVLTPKRNSIIGRKPKHDRTKNRTKGKRLILFVRWAGRRISCWRSYR